MKFLSLSLIAFSLYSLVLHAAPPAASEPPAADGPGGPAASLAWAQQRVRDGEGAFAASGFSRMPSPARWSGEVVYQILVDRFADGDPSNNRANIEDFQVAHQDGDRWNLEGYRHGGDLQGILNRLDYLQHLGVTSLWITPILKSSGSYHGYCTSDPSQVDPGFGDEALFRKVVAEAHKRGIKVVLDIVVNHMCSNDSHYDDQKTPFQNQFYDLCIHDHASKNWTNSGEIRGQRELVFGPSFFKPLRNPYFFNRCGFRPGDSTSGGDGAVFGDFSDKMFDFDTNNWDFQDIFTELHKYWIASADVDGFRMDAAKHVTADFIARFSTGIRDYARKIGKNNFFVLGEVAASAGEQAQKVGRMTSDVQNPQNSQNIAATLRERLVRLRDTYLSQSAWPFPGLNAIYDFSHSGQAVDVLRGWTSPMAIKNWFWKGGELQNENASDDFAQLAANGDTRMNWNMIEIHDWPRFLVHAPHGFKLDNALGYLLTTEGVPILYYGVEQGFNAACPTISNSIQGAARDHVNYTCSLGDFTGDAHPKYRQDMFVTGPWRLGSRVPEIQALAGIGDTRGTQALDWHDDPYLNTGHSQFKYVRKLIAIRKSCDSLQEGNVYFRAVHNTSGANGGGLLAFSRIVPGSDDEILVIVNNSDNRIPIQRLGVDPNIQNPDRTHGDQKFLNLFNPGEAGVLRRDSNGAYLDFGGFTSQPNSVAIFVYQGNFRPDPEGLETAVCWK